ncbi:MAG: SDR family NAD(P)-dependent oxidoreductase [Candidatus Dadabacteria bacterium]|nr:SDR family NAD(P)-dependent oxidoreductase [Candidatus Dadabacteria bacterium]
MPSYLGDHRVQDSVMYPGSAYVEMALAAARESFGQETCVLEDIMLQRPIILSHKESLTAQLILDSKQTSFDIYSRTDGAGGSWVRHATGKLRRLQDSETSNHVSLDEIRRRCGTEVPKSLFYQRFYDEGIQYGPYFQGVEHLYCGKRESLGEVQIHPNLEMEIRDYLLHPAMLDSCFQVILGAMASEKRYDAKGAYLPVHIERVELYGRPGNKLYSHVLLTERSASHIKADIELLDDTGKTLAKINGFRCQFVPSTYEKTDGYLYQYKWKLTPREDQASVNRSTDHMVSPPQIAKRLKPEAKRLSGELDRKKYYESLDPKLRVLVSAYILNAFQKLGLKFSTRQPISLNSLRKRLGVIPEQQRFFERLLQMLEEDRITKEMGGRWKFTRLPKMNDPQEIWKSLWAEFPSYLAELTLLRQCGDNLAEVLSGKADPLELLFPQGSLTTLEHLYQDSPSCRVYNLLVQKAVATALEKLPEGRTVRILELGGGTGGMTSYVLRKLPQDRTEYVFTDVTQFFLSHAEQKFHYYPFVRYQILDIEKDPVEQGFCEHSFDMILASDVLHATRNLRDTLYRVKKLLASEGLLVLLEGTHTKAFAILIFGMLRGWWLFEDDLRQKDPWISQESWQNLLEEVGFKEVASITDTENTDSALHSVIMAKGPLVRDESPSWEPALPKPENPGTWLIFTDNKGVGRNIGERLENLGETSAIISAGERYKRINENHFHIRPGRLEDIQKVVRESLEGRPVWRGVIHLWSLDTPHDGDTSPFSLDKAMDLGSITVLHLVQALTRADSSDIPRIFLVTSGAERIKERDKSLSVAQAPLWGFSRVLANEHPNLRSKIIDLSSTIYPEEIQSLFEELWLEDKEDEVALRGKARYVHRLARVSRESIHRRSKKKVLTRNNQPFTVEITTPGMLDRLTLKSVTRRKPGPREVEIEIHAAALNFKDIMIAMGLLPDEALEGGYTGKALGMEGAGKIVAVGEGVEELTIGDEVILCAPRVLRTFLTVDAGFVVKKPAHLSLEEAATIPIAFLTSHYSLHNVGQIRKGERILIHAATGGVGLSAIQLAQRIGAEIFATAGTQAKRDLLRALGVKYVMNSRSLGFADEVMQYTNGKGVDIVLNSLSGEAIPKSISVLSSYGRFIEIGKRDIYENSKLDLRPFRNNLSFSAIDLDRLCTERPEMVQELLHEVMRLFEDGTLRPLPHRVFPVSEIVNAFRYMAQAKHIGKVVVSFQEHEADPSPLPPKGFSVRNDGTYLITGGLGGFGLATAKWLVERGAKHLVLMGRRGATTEEAISSVEAMKKAGVNLVVVKADVTRNEQVARVLRDVHKRMPPLRGVIHAAMVIDDAIILQLNEERMRKVMAPKIIGAWNLHSQTLDLPLDFFVLFSSISSLFGSPGQGNYAAGNSFLDAVSQYRHAQGLPALTVNWGGIADVGYVAANPEIGEKLEHIGMRSMTSEKCLTILGELLQHEAIQTGVSHIDWKQVARTHITAPTPRIAHFIEANLSEDGKGGQAFLIDTIMALKPEDRRQFLESFLCEQLARVLGASPSKLDVNQPLLQMGIDSLMAVEIGIQIETELGINVPTVKFMEGVNLSGLAAFVVGQLDAKASPESKVTEKKAPESPDIILETLDQEANLSLRKSPSEDVYQEAVFPTPSPLVRIQASGSKPPLFFVHPVSGNVFCYLKLSQRLGKERPFYAIRSPGLNGEMKPLTRIEDMADHYISAIRAVQEKGPYMLGGWSMGGVIAFEMAQRLEMQGEKVALLALFDIQETAYVSAKPKGIGYFLTSLVRDLGVPLDDNDSLALSNLLQLGPDKRWSSFMDFAKDTKADKNIRDLLSKLAVHIGLTTDQVIFLLNRYYEVEHDRLLDLVGEYIEFINKETRKVGHSEIKSHLGIYFNNHLAIRSYKPKVYRSPLVLFTPNERLGTVNQENGVDWTGFFAGELEIHEVPGNHYSMMEEPNIQVIADKLSVCLEKAHNER